MSHTVRLTKVPSSKKLFETGKPVQINFQELCDSGELPERDCRRLQDECTDRRIVCLGIDAGRFAIGIKTGEQVKSSDVFYLSQKLAELAVDPV